MIMLELGYIDDNFSELNYTEFLQYYSIKRTQSLCNNYLIACNQN